MRTFQVNVPETFLISPQSKLARIQPASPANQTPFYPATRRAVPRPPRIAHATLRGGTA